MSGLWRLTVRADFSAAHALRHYQGKCERPHGHNFMVSVSVEGGPPDPRTGMILDFKTLKGALSEALKSLDHRMLNETPPFDGLNPSSENIALHLWGEIRRALDESGDPHAAGVRLHKVAVAEKEGQEAEYFGPDPAPRP